MTALSRLQFLSVLRTPLALAIPGILAATLPSTHAAVASNGDIFLAFRATGGQGASESYIVNLGQDTQFRPAGSGAGTAVAGATITLNVGATGTDLISLYGGDWATRPDLSWGIFGVRTSGSSTIYGSRAQNPAGILSTPWAALSSQDRNSTGSAISSVIDQPGGFTTSPDAAGSSVAVRQTNTGNTSSYSFQVGTAGTSDFGSLSGWTSIEGGFGAGADGTALDLHRLAGANSERLGTFTISSAGVLQFTAVPEPSGMLLTASAAVLALASRRRRPPVPSSTAGTALS